LSNENFTSTQQGTSLLGKKVSDYTLFAIAAVASYILMQLIVTPTYNEFLLFRDIQSAGITDVVDAGVIAPDSAPQLSDELILFAVGAAVQLLLFVILLSFMHYTNRELKSRKWYRNIWDPRAKFEGRWLEIFYDEDTLTDGKLLLKNNAIPRYAIIDIVYLGPKTDRYAMFGASYYPNSLYNSFWRSRSMIFYPEDKRIEYLFTSDDNGGNSNIRGVGSLCFRGKFEKSNVSKKASRKVRRLFNGREELHSGIGTFSVNNTSGDHHYVEFIRITDEEIAALVDNRVAMHPAIVLRNFIREYHQRFGSMLSEGLVDPVMASSEGNAEGESTK